MKLQSLNIEKETEKYVHYTYYVMKGWWKPKLVKKKGYVHKNGWNYATNYDAETGNMIDYSLNKAIVAELDKQGIKFKKG